MALTFEHRCPGVDKDQRENCKQRQDWELEGTNVCSACGFQPDADWRRQMATLLGINVDALATPEPVPAEESAEATPEAEESGGEEASPPDEAGTASGARPAGRRR